MNDIKLIKCDMCGVWYDLTKIENKNDQEICDGCGRPKETKEVQDA